MELEFIPQKEINIRKLEEIFNRAFIECEIEDGDLKVIDEYDCYLDINKDIKSISYMMAFQLKDFDDEMNKYKFINMINQYAYCSAHITESNLVILNHISYDSGIYSHQIVRTYKQFYRSSAQALASADEKYDALL